MRLCYNFKIWKRHTLSNFQCAFITASEYEKESFSVSKLHLPNSKEIQLLFVFITLNYYGKRETTSTTIVYTNIK